MKKEKGSLVILLFFATTALLVIVALISAFYFLSYRDTIEEITYRQMQTLGASLTVVISADELDQYADIDDVYSEEYYSLIERLNTAVRESNVDFVHILRYDPIKGNAAMVTGDILYTPQDLNMAPESTMEDILYHLLVDHREAHMDFVAFHEKDTKAPIEVVRVIEGEKLVIKNVKSEDTAGHLLSAFTPILYKDGSHSNYVIHVEQTISDIANLETAQTILFTLFGIALIATILTTIFSFRQYKIQADESTKANDAKSGFLTRMSHEIRTPMNAIIGMTKIADKTDDTEQLQYCISTIENSSTHLLQLINDVLDVSKIEAGKLILDSDLMNLEKMLMKLCNIFIVQADNKKLDFNIVFENNMHMHYIADELRLSQTLHNLFSNAIKYTPENGSVTLTIKELERHFDYSIVQFSVSDTGLGIRPENLARLRESFEMMDVPTTDQYGGAGLGLVICKSIINKMGGKMSVESEVGIGSTFSFTIRMDRPEEQIKPTLVSNIRPTDIKLLIAENNDELRDQLSRIVRGFDIKPEEVSTSAETVECVDKAHSNNTPYDVIIIDQELPDMSGIDTINSLSDKIDKNTIIIVTTFATYNDIVELAHGISIDKFIVKPFFPSSILDAINEALSKSTKLIKTVRKSHEDVDFTGKHILLAEDVEINRIIFSSLLEGTNLNIDIATNGLEAVNLFQLNPTKYDLIVMDVQMPKMDGLEASSTIRKMNSRFAKKIPIIAMTANAFKEDIAECLKAGMDDHIAKPVDEKILVEKLATYFNEYDRMAID